MPDRSAESAGNLAGAPLPDALLGDFLSGAAILDIGRGDRAPIVPHARVIAFDADPASLAIADASQDAIYAGDCLARIHDFRAALREWFRLLRTGGFLVLTVPHQYLHEKRLALPSRVDPERKRFYTPGLLLLDIESALPPNGYRLRHLADDDEGFDYNAPPDARATGGDAIKLVIEKIAPPGWILATDAPARPGVAARAGAQQVAARAEPVLPATHRDDGREIAPGMQDQGGMLARDFAPPVPRGGRICVLKLDHFGDFIIGMPALDALRRAFPDHHIRLVCGSWNLSAAKASGLADEIRSYDFFPEHAGAWNREPVQGAAMFAAAVEGAFDMAIDLRVDEDTRHLLADIDATVRCGIGARHRFPFLDIALPLEYYGRFNDNPTTQPELLLPPERFASRMRRQAMFAHETRFAGRAEALVDGPGITLPTGTFRACFGIAVSGFLPGPLGSSVMVEVARNDRVIAAEVFGRRTISGLAERPPMLEFANDDPAGRHDFRIRATGHPLAGTLRFTGTRIAHLTAPPPARMQPVEIHNGEQMGLLVELVRQRTRDLYRFLPTSDIDPTSALEGARRIVIAPFSNSSLRDWPIDKYAALVERLLAGTDCEVVLIGSRQQVEQANRIVARNGGDARIVNLAGRTRWDDIPRVLAAADLVICNNSGVAHQAAALGLRTLAIHSGSHQPQEWGPRGVASRAIMAPVPCSPCGLERIEQCPNQTVCMELISPDYVFETALQMLRDQRLPNSNFTQRSGAVTRQEVLS